MHDNLQTKHPPKTIAVSDGLLKTIFYLKETNNYY